MEISIKKPCHENWEAMTPNQQGAFCGKCVKTVIDFSNKTLEEIKDFFAGKESQTVCGRFEKSQLTSLSFNAFFKEFKAFNITKRFAVIVYFTFGLWLFNSSTVSAQTDTVKQIDIPIDPLPQIMGGVRIMPPQDTTSNCIRPTAKPKMVKGKVARIETRDMIQPKLMGETIVEPESKQKPKNKNK